MNAAAIAGDRYSGRLRVRDTELWIEKWGRGSPLLLTLHGGLGFDHTCFRPWLDPLAEDATLVHFDLRGQGRSERLAADDWATVLHATFVADIDAIRAALGHERLILFGHSYGAFLALDYALAHPERLSALILSGGACAFDHGTQVAANAMARDSDLGPRFLKVISRTMLDDATFARDFPELLPLYFHRWDPSRAFMRDTLYSAAAMNHAFGKLVPAWNVRDRLHEIETPTLVIVGDDDFITPRDTCADVLAREIPRAHLKVIAESGHFPFAENQETFIDVVHRFMRALET